MHRSSPSLSNDGWRHSSSFDIWQWLLFLSWMQGCRIGFLKPQKPNLLNLGFFILCNLMNKLYIKIVIVRLINFIFIFTWCSSPSLTGESLRTSYCVWDVFHVLLGSTLKTYVFQHCLSDTVVGFYYFLLLSALLVFWLHGTIIIFVYNNNTTRYDYKLPLEQTQWPSHFQHQVLNFSSKPRICLKNSIMQQMTFLC